MVANTHNIMAVATLLTAAVYYPPDNLTLATILLALIANVIGSLLPDLDQASNRLWDLLPGGDGLGRLLKHIFLAHRTLSHSILGIFLVYKAVYWLTPKLFNLNYIDYNPIALALIIGYISHLVADGLTEEGLPLLFPLKIKFGFPPVKKLRIKSGHWFEKYIVVSGAVVYLLWLLINNWQILLKMCKI